MLDAAVPGLDGQVAEDALIGAFSTEYRCEQPGDAEVLGRIEYRRRRAGEAEATGLVYGPAPFEAHHGGGLWLKDSQG